jgi:hypothetical protein
MAGMLLALLLLSPDAASAASDPEGRFAFTRPLPPVADEPLRSPGRPGELRLVRLADPSERGLRVAVLVEGRLRVSAQSFARAVGDALHDPRGWRSAGYRFRLVARPPAEIQVVLASPGLTDSLCAPLLTLGRYSCAQGDRAVLNFTRWQEGIPHYGSLARYRIYMVNHEVGHLLGRGHTYCSGAGALAPLMMQQTKSVAPCRPNPWPLPGE